MTEKYLSFQFTGGGKCSILGHIREELILTELENQIRGSIPLTIERRSSIMRFSGFFPL